MVAFTGSTTASWLTAGLYLFAAGYFSPASAIFPIIPTNYDSLQKRQFIDFDFKWAGVKPSRELQWQPCYEESGLECARLIVPMDYDNCFSNQTVTLAVIKRPAKDKENYLGPVFVNPGGPGGSGIDWVLFQGPEIHRRLGTNHDLISWDPRGVSRSTPKQSCWANLQRRAVWSERWAPMDLLDEFNDPNWIRQITEQYKYEHQSCKALLGRTGILEHTHTAHHAHDLDRLLTATGHDKLRFWGFSWGSTLATYYATLFPNRVGRILSEANVDVRYWVEGDLIPQLLDAPRHLNYVYETCAADKDCGLHEPTADGVRRRLEALLNDLRERPRIQVDRWNGLPELYTHAHAIRALDMGLRNMMFLLPNILQDLALLEKNEAPFQWSERDAVGDGDMFPEFSDVERWDVFNPDYGTDYLMMSTLLQSEEITQCADWPEINLDVHYLQSEIHKGLEYSPTGATATARRLWCAGSTRPKKRFEGPFGGNTSFPILFVNGWDIITPANGAFRNAEIFPDSRVVTLDSFGHGITLSSRCVNKHVLAYFQNGTLPAQNSTCDDIPGLVYGDDFQWPNPFGEDWEDFDDEEDIGPRAVERSQIRRDRDFFNTIPGVPDRIAEKIRLRESLRW